MSIKALVPWQARLIGKLILARIPSSYWVWQRIGLFKHGWMEQPEYAYKVFRKHFDSAVFPKKKSGFTALELGPGDSLFSALTARAFGASSIYLVDAGRFARDDIGPYLSMAAFLERERLPIPGLEKVNSLDDILACCGAHYGTVGIKSLKDIPEGTVDFIWSQAVLEHIRRGEFLDTMVELRRVLSKDGVCSHRIDFMDHLGGALNNLRFPRKVWESDFMANSGFYTNRIRYAEMLGIFEDAGFEVSVTEIRRWDRLPTPRTLLSAEFRNLPEEDLLIAALDVTLKPR